MTMASTAEARSAAASRRCAAEQMVKPRLAQGGHHRLQVLAALGRLGHHAHRIVQALRDLLGRGHHVHLAAGFLGPGSEPLHFRVPRLAHHDDATALGCELRSGVLGPGHMGAGGIDYGKPAIFHGGQHLGRHPVGSDDHRRRVLGCGG